MREFIRRNNPFNRHFVRNLEAGTLLEIFLVTAVCSVLGIRFFLALTGYPSLSPGHLHIAHVLLGGVLMMIALVINLGYINKSANYLVAVIGGLGFGAFIDELGKFITGDNDYFFQPTVALIYIIFALLYLAIQTFIHKPKAHRAGEAGKCTGAGKGSGLGGSGSSGEEKSPGSAKGELPE